MAITAGSNANASDFIDNSTRDSTTPANDSGKVAKLESNGRVHSVLLSPAIGGDGSDGSLTITSGTTNIDLAGAQYVIKQYKTLSITGTGALTFSNPHAKGTVVIIKVQGDATITTSATRAIDLRGIGASATNQPTGAAFDVTLPSTTTGGSQYPNPNYYTGSSSQWFLEGSLKVACGVAGIAGGDGPQPAGGGTSGRGGGVLYLEVGGAYNCTGTIDASGQDGGNGANGTGSNEASGGGGGGSAGMIVVLYSRLTADSGTYNLLGGKGGDSGAPAGATGTGGDGGGGGGSRSAGGGNGGTNSAGSAAAGAGAGGGGGGGQATGAGAARAGGTAGSTLSAVRCKYN